MYIAQARLTGALPQEPELRYTAGGQAVMNFTLAGEHVELIEDGDAARVLPFYQRITIWGGRAETLAETMHAGDAAFVLATLQQNSYEDRGGVKRSSVEVRANTIRLLDATNLTFTTDKREQPRLEGAINEVLLVGNVTRDAAVRTTPNQQHSVMNFGIAVNDGYYNQKTRERAEHTSFFEVVAWNDLAEAQAELAKGQPLMITGRLTNSSYEDREGIKRYKTQVDARNILRLTRIAGSGATKTEGGTRAQPATSSRLNIDEEFPPEEDLPF